MDKKQPAITGNSSVYICSNLKWITENPAFWYRKKMPVFRNKFTAAEDNTYKRDIQFWPPAVNAFFISLQNTGISGNPYRALHLLFFQNPVKFQQKQESGCQCRSNIRHRFRPENPVYTHKYRKNKRQRYKKNHFP